MKRLAWPLLAGIVGLAVPAAAQETSPVPSAVPPPQEAAASVTQMPQAPQVAPPEPLVLDPTAPARTEVTIDRRNQLGAGMAFSGPLGAVASLRLLHGLGADVKDGSTRVKAVCAVPMPHCAQGFLLQLDGGSGGGKLSLGVGAWANIKDDDFRGTAGAALRLALARTWGHPIGTDPGLTYLGPELDVSVLRINLTLGALFKLAGDGGAGALFSWGLGFGL